MQASPEQARTVLGAHPQLAYALFQAMLLMNVVEPSVLSVGVCSLSDLAGRIDAAAPATQRMQPIPNPAAAPPMPGYGAPPASYPGPGPGGYGAAGPGGPPGYGTPPGRAPYATPGPPAGYNAPPAPGSGPGPAAYGQPGPPGGYGRPGPGQGHGQGQGSGGGAGGYGPPAQGPGGYGGPGASAGPGPGGYAGTPSQYPPPPQQQQQQQQHIPPPQHPQGIKPNHAILGTLPEEQRVGPARFAMECARLHADAVLRFSYRVGRQAMIMQVLALSNEQVHVLPPDQKASVMQLVSRRRKRLGVTHVS